MKKYMLNSLVLGALLTWVPHNEVVASGDSSEESTNTDSTIEQPNEQPRTWKRAEPDRGAALEQQVKQGPMGMPSDAQVEAKKAVAKASQEKAKKAQLEKLANELAPKIDERHQEAMRLAKEEKKPYLVARAKIMKQRFDTAKKVCENEVATATTCRNVVKKVEDAIGAFDQRKSDISALDQGATLEEVTEAGEMEGPSAERILQEQKMEEEAEVQRG